MRKGDTGERVGELCVHAAFCVGRTRPIAKMLADTDDSDIRSDVMSRIDHCPSGSYSYALHRGGDTVEVDLPQAISVLEEENGQASALWVSGRVPVHRSDSRPQETRNRVTLCRCGHSANKPLCDGTHRKIGFRETGRRSRTVRPHWTDCVALESASAGRAVRLPG
ncbi:divergent 4Fe-4S mono-cluster protein [Lentzea atacamensis]|uniref:Divergent 4Fe-4S mono-cluster protein n=1 Tax=Lentzea atacamensis TaxID=531938 RepID=A0A316HAQ7_9PSEU|nr:CDGSH iron-sulfur domain-containing protein [Lentzea atacamensis]PWK77477.1 divergent 4Fe-4S mono-cluster protein [Lentzea atacamensis]